MKRFINKTKIISTDMRRIVMFLVFVHMGTCLLLVNAQNIEPVDLGLSVEWANMNVGADTPEEYGSYFAWGEVKTKRYYGDFSNNKYLDDKRIHKYNYLPLTNSKYDNLTVLLSEDDAATRNLGSKWRMPTEEEVQELIDNCEFVKDTLNGTRGYLVKNKNGVGESMFLPFAGWIDYGRHRLYPGTSAYYWTATLDNWNQVNIVKEKANKVLEGTLHKDSLNIGIVRESKCLILSDDDPIINYVDRRKGCAIRPVYVGKR